MQCIVGQVLAKCLGSLEEEVVRNEAAEANEWLPIMRLGEMRARPVVA